MFRLSAIAVFACSMAASASAQYGYYSTTPIEMSIRQQNWYNLTLWNNLAVQLRTQGYSDAQLKDLSYEQMEALVKKGAKPGTGSASGSRTPAKPAKETKPAAPVATRFTPKGKRIVLEDVIKAMGSTQEERDGLRTLFTAGFKAFEDGAKEAKMSNDLAMAMAYFVATALMLEGDVVGDKAVIDLAYAIQDVFDQPTMRKATSEEKQAFSEFLVIMGTFLLASKEQLDSTSDAETLSGLRETSRSVLKKFLKLDPTQYKLTDNGLARR